jgi:hypothetical protein
MLLPERLPVLFVRGKVLLPSSVMRVVVSSARSLALVEALLTSKNPLDGVWLGVVFAAPAGADEALKVDGEALHGVGCAARVLQISRFPAGRRCARRALRGCHAPAPVRPRAARR